MPLPFETESQLDDALSAPDESVIEVVAAIDGPVLVAGAGGKMGSSLCRMVRRGRDAVGSREPVIAVSRFRNEQARLALEKCGVQTVQTDLLDRRQLENLPDASTVISMVGFKFGAATRAPHTWATNVILPAMLCERFPTARFAAFSSGNIYGMTSVSSGGSTVDSSLHPTGEYAHTVLGRERVYEYYGLAKAIPSVLLRLNYAVEMRYGVLVDIARQVRERQPIDLAMGYVNVIWQGDANRMALRAIPLASAEAPKLNIAGPRILSVRETATRFAELWGMNVEFRGTESDTAYLNDASASFPLIGQPRVTEDELIEWTAEWMRRGLPQWNLPTHFQNRGGAF